MNNEFDFICNLFIYMYHLRTRIRYNIVTQLISGVARVFGLGQDRGSGGRKSASGVQGEAPVGGLEAEAFS